MAKPDLGMKRIDPETGRKFYDLNKDPIVSPYTGKSYPRSYFDMGADNAVEEEEEEIEKKELDAEDSDAEVVSLEEADEEASGASSDSDDDDVDLGDDEEDTFLEAEEEEEDDVSGIIGVGGEDEEA